MIRLYIGKSASGKNYFLQKDVEEGYKPIISVTTRPMRPGEVQDVDYHFITGQNVEDRNAKFLEMVKAGDFMEYRKYDTVENEKPAEWYYGSPVAVNYDSINYVGIVDVDGAMSYIEFYGIDNVEVILVTASADSRRQRAFKREKEKDPDIEFNVEEQNRRFLDDEKKFSEDKIDELCRLCGGEITMIVNEYESGYVFREARYAPEYADILAEVAVI